MFVVTCQVSIFAAGNAGLVYLIESKLGNELDFYNVADIILVSIFFSRNIFQITNHNIKNITIADTDNSTIFGKMIV